MDQGPLIALIPRLRRYARLLTGDASRADDLVQETLARACEKWPLFRPGSDLRAWLFTLMHNVSENLRRGQTGRERELPLDAVTEPGFESTPGLDELLDLRRGLAALSDEHRHVLLLVGIEQMSYADAAGVLQVPVGTVMSRLSRARDQLRFHLDPAAPRPVPRPALRVAK